MTDKQIIIDGIDVSGCINYRPDVETTQINYTNACSIGIWQRWYSNLEPNCIMSCSCKYNPNCHYKQLKRSEAQCEAMFVSHTDLEKKYKAKEQECEELKKIIDEAKNSKLDLKSFLVGEAVQNEYEQQLNQLKAELTRANCQIADDEILQCDMREAIEALKAEYDKLKRENDLAKQLINWILKFFKLTDYDWQYDQNEISDLIRDCFDDKQSTIDFVNDINKGLFKTLTEIKEIAEEVKGYDPLAKQILEKISECEVVDEF